MYENSNELGNAVLHYLEYRMPPEILNYINEGTVLSGGTVTRAITNEYQENIQIVETPEVIEFLQRITHLRGMDWYPLPGRRDVGQMADYDLYTEREPADVAHYFKSHGYQIRGINGNMPEEIQVYADPEISAQYTGWLMRLVKNPFEDDEVDLDIIFVGKVHRRYPEHTSYLNNFIQDPKEFISKEFDFRACKIWYDGNIVEGVPGAFNDIDQRILKFDFHPEMTINCHKLKTTADRILKYRNRGFSFVDSLPLHGLDQWYRKFLYCGMYSNVIISPENVFNEVTRIVNVDGILEEDAQLQEQYNQNSSLENPMQFHPNTSEGYKLVSRMFRCIARIGSVDTLAKFMNPPEGTLYHVPFDIISFQNGNMCRFTIGFSEAIFFLNSILDRLVHPSAMVIYRLIEKLIYIRYKEDLWSPVLGDELINTYTYALRILVNSSSGTVKQQLRRIFNNRIFITDEGRYQYEVITAMVVRLRGILEYVFDVEGAVQYINTHIINSTTLRGLNNCFRFELGGSFDYRPVKISKCFPENWIDVIPSNFPVSLRTKLNVLFPQWNPAVTNVIAVLEGDYLRNEEYYLVNENGTLVNYEPINAPEPVPVVNNDQVGFPVDDVGPEWEPFQPHEPAPAPAPAPVENFFEVGRLNAAMRNDEMKLDFNNGFIRDLQRGLVNHEALTTIYDNNLRNFFDTRYGALCLYGSLAFLGEIIQQEPLSAEQSRRHSLAKVLSRFRMVPEGEVNLENRSLDLVSGEYIVISLGYGPRTMFYGIRKDTIELVFNNVMRGETVYNSCIKLQGFVADNDRVTVETTECYAKIPIGVPVFVDLVTLYKLYLLSKVFRPVENEQLIVYLEMVSSDVLMKSFNRASPGDERNVFAIGRVVSNRAEVSFNLSDLLSDYLEIVNAPAAVGPASPAAPAPAAGPTAVGPASPAAPAGSPINLSLGSRYSVTPMRSPMRSPLELSPDRRSAKPPGSSHDRI